MKSTNSGQKSANSPVVNSYTSSADMSVNSAPQNSAQSQTGGKTNQQVKNIIGVFSSQDSAEKAVSELRTSGFSTEEINIISKEGKKSSRHGEEFYDDDITDGTLTGGTLGGLGGLLLGAGALAIPGIGPVLAAGPIAGAIGGAVAGGIAGGLIDWGIPAESSQRYERNVEEGDILAIIRSDAAKVNKAAQVLRQYGARDVESHDAK